MIITHIQATNPGSVKQDKIYLPRFLIYKHASWAFGLIAFFFCLFLVFLLYFPFVLMYSIKEFREELLNPLSDDKKLPGFFKYLKEKQIQLTIDLEDLHKACEKYERKNDTAYAERTKTTNKAWEERYKKIKEAWAECDEKINEADEECEAKIKEAKAKCEKTENKAKETYEKKQQELYEPFKDQFNAKVGEIRKAINKQKAKIIMTMMIDEFIDIIKSFDVWIFVVLPLSLITVSLSLLLFFIRRKYLLKKTFKAIKLLVICFWVGFGIYWLVLLGWLCIFVHDFLDDD